jgi:hypothetical protein
MVKHILKTMANPILRKNLREIAEHVVKRDINQLIVGKNLAIKIIVMLTRKVLMWKKLINSK